MKTRYSPRAICQMRHIRFLDLIWLILISEKILDRVTLSQSVQTLKKWHFSKWPPCPYIKYNFHDIFISRPDINILLVPKLMFSGSTNPIKYFSATLVHDLFTKSKIVSAKNAYSKSPSRDPNMIL